MADQTDDDALQELLEEDGVEPAADPGESPDSDEVDPDADEG